MEPVKQSGSHDLPKATRKSVGKKFISHQQSEVIELFVASELAMNGWCVSFPRSSHAPYDMLIEREGVVLRIQVKSTRSLERYSFETRRYFKVRDRRQITCADCDVIIMVAFVTREMFIVPTAEVHGTHFQITEKNRNLYHRNYSLLKPCKPKN